MIVQQRADGRADQTRGNIISLIFVYNSTDPTLTVSDSRMDT